MRLPICRRPFPEQNLEPMLFLTAGHRPVSNLSHADKIVTSHTGIVGSEGSEMHRLPAIFIADVPGLDFLNSIATPVDTPIDWIEDGEGLLNWLDQARLVPGDALAALRAQALPGELDHVADQARSLRE